jgi:hypothetical protein
VGNAAAAPAAAVITERGADMSGRTGVVAAVALAGSLLVAGPGTAVAAGGAPVITRGGETVTFADDFLLDLCGIETETTLTERWTLKEYPDGSETLQVARTFVSADPQIPVEKGAGTAFTAPDGSRRVVGTPLHLIGPHGVRIIDAGQVTFAPDGDVVSMRGPHPSLDADLAEYYCP